MKSISSTFKWQGIEIRFRYTPRYCAIARPTLSHVEVMSIEPPRAEIPITETGYKSMFFYSENIYSEEKMVSMLIEKLDHAANRNGWREQLSLF